MDSKQSSSTVIPDHQPSAIEKLVAFLDERVGLKEMQAKMLNEPIPGGSRWAYVFGSILLFIFAMQALTGILLMFYYVPTADHAYASTQYIIHDVDYGWFLLGYHFWGSSVSWPTCRRCFSGAPRKSLGSYSGSSAWLCLGS
jgi:ubiquinol-cytochrome c reductase cytochrome b subunit